MARSTLKFRLVPGCSFPSVEAVKDFLGSRTLFRTRRPITNQKGSEADLSEFDDPKYIPADHDNATLVTSELPNGNHMVGIDIDHPCMLIESSPGHYHLYVNVEMVKAKYFSMLNAMVLAGVIEPGYYAHAVRRGATFLRYPGVTKANERDRIEETRPYDESDIDLDDVETY